MHIHIVSTRVCVCVCVFAETCCDFAEHLFVQFVLSPNLFFKLVSAAATAAAAAAAAGTATAAAAVVAFRSTFPSMVLVCVVCE